MTRKLFLLALALLLLTVPQAYTQTDGETSADSGDDSGLFFETVDVNLVNVDVWVTDKAGNPIHGLTAEDFEVFENKRPVQITNFYAVAGGEPVTPVVPTAPEEEPGETRAVADTPPIPEDQLLSVVVYIDNFNIRPFNRNRVFRRLREFLYDKLDQRDRVMLVSYDRSLNIRHPFTSDSRLIASSLYDLEKLSGHAVHLDSERRDILRDLNQAESVSEVEWRVRQFAESQYNDLMFTIDAMKEIVISLAGLPGRKAFVYVSDGLPMTPGEDLFHALQARFHDTSALNRMMDFQAGRKFTQVAAEANSNRVNFYNIDASGLRVHSSATAEVSGESVLAGMSTLVDSIDIQNYQSTLRFLAEETGGRAIVNTNDVGAGPGEDRQRFSELLLARIPAGTRRRWALLQHRGQAQGEAQGGRRPAPPGVSRQEHVQANGRRHPRQPAVRPGAQPARRQLPGRRQQSRQGRALQGADPGGHPDRQDRARAAPGVPRRAGQDLPVGHGRRRRDGGRLGDPGADSDPLLPDRLRSHPAVSLPGRDGDA